MRPKEIEWRIQELTQRVWRLEQQVTALGATPVAFPAMPESPTRGASSAATPAAISPASAAAPAAHAEPARIGERPGDLSRKWPDPGQTLPPRHPALASITRSVLARWRTLRKPAEREVAEPVVLSSAEVPAAAAPAPRAVAASARARLGLMSDAAPAGPTRESPTLEVRIGMSWMAWAGALLIVLASGFFVKLAYDQGWLGRIPPLVRCLMSAGLGACLLAGGELALRRINRAAAVSLFSAGTGVLYLTAFATFRYFHLVEAGAAFALMTAAAAVGVLITVRGRSLTIGILSLLFGYLTPILLAKTQSFPGALPLYLSALLAVGLGLSAWKPQSFRPLRYLTLVLQALLGALWVDREGVSEWRLGIVFITVWWTLATAEVTLAAIRNQSRRGNAIASFFATAWFAVIGCWVLKSVSPAETNWLGLFTGVVAALAAVLAAFLGAGLSVLRLIPRTAPARLSLSLWLQVGVLTATAVGLQFEGPGAQGVGQTIGWLVMGVCCVELGRRLHSRPVDRFGLVVGLLGLWRLVVVDPGLRALHTPIWVYPVGSASFSVTGYLGLLLLAIVSLLAVAVRLRLDQTWPRKALVRLLVGLAAFGWIIACEIGSSGFLTPVAYAAGAILVIAAESRGRTQGFLEIARTVLLLAAARWLLFVEIAARANSTWNPQTITPLWNPLLTGGVAAVAGLVLAAWMQRRREIAASVPRAECDSSGPATLAGGQHASAGSCISAVELDSPVIANRVAYRWPLVAAVLLALAALSCEMDILLDRSAARGLIPPAPRLVHGVWPISLARLLWNTLLWSAAGCVLTQLSKAPRLARLRETGWALLLCGAAVWLTGDTVIARSLYGVQPAAVAFNAQAGVGAAIALMLGTVAILSRRAAAVPAGIIDASAASRALFLRQAASAAIALAAAIGLWLGSIELDRFFTLRAARFADAAMARQTALSIWWGVYAIAILAAGFARRVPWARYAGLALLAITLGKVLILDMAEVRYVYRVLSFLGLGLLLIVTSIAYAKLSGRLRTEVRPPAHEPGPHSGLPSPRVGR